MFLLADDARAVCVCRCMYNDVFVFEVCLISLWFINTGYRRLHWLLIYKACLAPYACFLMFYQLRAGIFTI